MNDQSPLTPEHADHDDASPPADTDRADPRTLLAEAVRVLTAAARLTHLPIAQTATGSWESDPNGRPEQNDWAEFVTLALAGAVANFGGVEAVLAGRPGSWEAEGVRQLLISTVGDEEATLWAHRTEPLSVTLYLEEILADVDEKFERQYEAANLELDARYEAIGIPTVVGHLDMTREEMTASAEGLPPATSEQDAAVAAIEDLQDRLEAQRVAEMRAYAQALEAKILAEGAAVAGLDVPLEVGVDYNTFRPTSDDSESLERRLVAAAVLDTPTPSTLPGTPLTRLQGAASSPPIKPASPREPS